MTRFSDVGLSAELVRAVNDLGYETPTPIQEETLTFLDELPEALIALSQTGTGKTAAFALPLLHHLDVSERHVQALVLCPTRELCLQITDDFKNLSKYMDGTQVTAVYGGAPLHVQAKSLKRGSHIVVGTPGRVVDMIKRRVLALDELQCFVLDEADEMLNMGFKDDLEFIFQATRKEKSTWLFSATMPSKVESIAKKYMKNAHRIETARRNEGASSVEHEYYLVKPNDRLEALKRVLDSIPDIYGVIFCRTRDETNVLASQLMGMGYPAEAINGSLTQQQRDRVMARFRKKQVTLLVATDVAARGIDVDDLTHVVNYAVPDDPEVYVHRSGRTGRAGKSGISIAIITRGELSRLKAIEKMTTKKFTYKKVPSIVDIGRLAVMSQVESFLGAELKGVSISGLLTDIHLALEDMSREELIEQLTKWLYQKAVRDRSDDRDLNMDPKSSRDKSKSGSKSDRQGRRRDRERDEPGKFVRLDFNIGRKQHMNPARLMGIINEVMSNSSINFGRIDILTHASSIDVEAKHAAAVVGAMNGTQFGHQRIKVQKGSEALGTLSRPPKQGRKPKPGGRGKKGSGRQGRKR